VSENLQVGDVVVYPSQGAAEVVNVEVKELGGTSQQFYTLRVMKTGRTLMLPGALVANVGLRLVIGEDQIARVYEILKQGAEVYDPAKERDIVLNNKIYAARREKIKMSAPAEVAEVLRDLTSIERHRELTHGEVQMIDDARGMLSEEIALATGTERAEVLEAIDRFLVKSQG